MRKSLFTILTLLLLGFQMASAQEYTVKSAGQGKDGRYLVDVVTYIKKKKLATDAINECAVRGVLFRGFTDMQGTTSQKPMIEDSSIQTAKSDFFEAFFREKAYEQFISIIPSSVSVCKVPKKHYEAEGVVVVDKESLYHYLEDHNIIKGFSKLW